MQKTNRTCLGEFTRYTILNVLGTLGVSCYILADTFFISKGLGTNGLAALNLAIPAYNFLYGTGLMLGMGGATKFSISKSQKKTEEGNRIYTNTLYMAAFFSILYVILGLFGSKPLARILGADEVVLEMTATYLKWLLIFAPAFLLNTIFLCFLRNDESPHLTMAAMIIGSFSNIILDYLFIFPMQMGILGAVLATGFSPLISILIMLPHWIKKKNTFHITKTKPRIGIIRQNLSLGLPSLIIQVSSGIVMITFNTLILNLEGNTGVAAYGVVANIAIVVIAVYNGISEGMQPLTSRFYGKGEYSLCRQVFRYGITAMTAVSVIVYVLIFLFADPITSIFNSEHSPALQQIASLGLKLYFLSNLFVGFNILLSVYFVSVDRPLPSQILSILKGIVLIVPIAIILSSVAGMTGIWLAYPFAELLTAIPGCIIYWKVSKNRK